MIAILNRSIFSLKTKQRHLAETKKSKNTNYTLLPHRILVPSPPLDPPKNVIKYGFIIFKMTAQSTQTQLRKQKLKKSVMGHFEYDKPIFNEKKNLGIPRGAWD